jgi:hypothetical protein
MTRDEYYSVCKKSVSPNPLAVGSVAANSETTLSRKAEARRRYSVSALGPLEEQIKANRKSESSSSVAIFAFGAHFESCHRPQRKNTSDIISDEETGP